jgi:hydrogenase nickel insertion protein HypA
LGRSKRRTCGKPGGARWRKGFRPFFRADPLEEKRVHELSIAHEIYRTSRAAVAAQGEGRIESVRVAVGELSAVEPDLLVYAWEAVVAEGPDAGARLDVDWHPARQHCPACGSQAERAPGSWLRLCPGCDQPLVVEGGDELDVLQVVFVPRDEEEAAND